MKRHAAGALPLLLPLLLLAAGCKQPQAQLRLRFPVDADAGVDAGACYQQTSLKCVNYLQFTAGRDESSSHCNRVEVELGDLCDLAKVAEGQEVFKLSPDTPLPITIEGLRVYPATGCSSTAACPPRRIFSGTTVLEGKIGDYRDGVIDLPVTVIEPCGVPEYFYPLPDGGTSTCEQVCGASPVVCANVEHGCLCRGDPATGNAARAMDGGQGGIDSGP
ncbi:MAG TPA: hypothetical protein VN903_22330 [Polyangia bacterium]|nr:hypothetical protein [Polyangia bacterium]